jgi:NADH:ubiquinone oxidoreductase subunit 3 (subunit A)
MSNDKQTYILRSLIGVVIALLVFIVVTLVGNAALKLLDTARGNRNLLQDFAREVGMPAFGAYVGLLSVDHFIKRYNKHIVFYLFSAIVVALIALSLVIQIPVASEAGITKYDLLLTALSGITSVGAAYITYKTKLN